MLNNSDVKVQSLKIVPAKLLAHLRHSFHDSSLTVGESSFLPEGEDTLIRLSFSEP